MRVIARDDRGERAAMEMHQIRYFLAVCDTLNFTRAAEHCNVSQPALTRAIQKLEEELGGLLFRRERTLTHLTDLGQLVRPRLQQISDQTEAAKTTAQGFLKLKDAPLNLGIMCTVGPLRGVGFLSWFREHNPGIELTLIEGVPSALSEKLREGSLDVAIMAQPEPFDERFKVEPLYREHFVVALPPGHRLAAQNAVRPQDLAGEKYLSRINCEFYDYLSDVCVARGVQLEDAYRSEREDWIQTMVLAGMGICFIPEFSPVLPGICQRRLIDPEVTRDVSMVTVSGRRYSPAVLAFIRAAKSYPWPEAA
jgi:DNA-binding transcriptional LysR family regulator